MTKQKWFDETTLSFFRRLEIDNDREWFEAHRKEYERNVLTPARHFVSEIGSRLKELRPGLQFSPAINQSIFRIYRDIRFSKDKSPYKTFLGILWWEGAGRKLESPSFYFQLDSDSILIGCGMYQFNKEQLEAYRQALMDDKTGKALIKAINGGIRSDEFEIGGKHYKNVPRGFDKDHLYSDYLKHNSLYFSYTSPIPKEFGSEGLAEWVMDVYRDMMPLHAWLVDVMKGV